MRKIIICILLTVASLVSNAQGINFFHGTYDEAKVLAEKEGKKIFIDVYTSWCGPCKLMAKNIFPLKEVGDFYNKNFICLKIDAEKEKDSSFFKEYKATSFPSYFWVSAKGELLDKQGGSCSAEVFISYGEKALKSNLGLEQKKLADRWNNGERSYELINSYVYKVLGVNDPSAVRPALEDFVKGLSDEEKKSKECFAVVSNFGRGITPDYLFSVFADNFKHYEAYASKYDTSIPCIYSRMYSSVVRSNTASYLSPKVNIKETDKAIKTKLNTLRKANMPYVNMYEDVINVEKYLYTKNYKKGISELVSVLDEYGEENPYIYSQLLYSIVLSKYLLGDTHVGIDSVLSVAEDNLRINPSKSAIFYYAVILKAMGRNSESIDALASMHFYKGDYISNAIYDNCNITNIRRIFAE